MRKTVARESLRLERGIFKTPRAAWAAVILYTVTLYGTLTIAFRLYSWVYDRMGKPFMSSAMMWIYAPLGLLLLMLLVFRLPRRAGAYLTFTMIGLALLYCLTRLEVPAKRFHFLQYAPLGVVVFDALRFHCRDRYHYIWAMAIVTLIGLGDEVLQGILPNRYFGVNEVVINSAAGFFALVFIAFVLGEENYPWPPKGAGKRGQVPGSESTNRTDASLAHK